MFFEHYYVEPVICSLRFWTLTGRLEINAALVPGKREAAERGLSSLERALTATPFLGGHSFTIADIANYAYAHLSADCGLSLDSYPAAKEWVARVAKQIGPGHPIVPYGREARPA
ncbi:glutathione S-transferase family protein [Dongia deserti]|uniref:glutathione S-transferase family protein n=1 Tax=Dongia deserti TaxID=2268030 RepID=UPI0025480DC3|nr:glutathione S-transferase family protein [Dongia deserti]